MKACVILALVLVVASIAVVHCTDDNEDVPEIHNLMKRQIKIGPQYPRCALWECNSNCIRRGFKGGYCAFTGCQCY